MSETKITDLVPQETIDKIKELNTEIQSLLSIYTQTAKELAKGVDVNVKVVGDIDKLEKLLVEKSREATTAAERLNTVIAQQGQIVANTTNTISRQLMEQERVNKAQRESYTEHEKVKRLLDHFLDTYENQAVSLVKVNKEIQLNKDAQAKLEKQLSAGQVSMSQYTQRMAELITQQRALSQEKKTLTQLMTAEEKAGQEVEDSYVTMSQKLELLKKAYKGLSEEGRSSQYGQELENTIQNLDAHLKDMAADIGEFQRNVGNYAISSKNGVVTTESLIAALNQEAHTVKDLTDQNKILAEARSMLDISSANYAETLAFINGKIDENNKKIDESGQRNASMKKDLKDLVLEIATLTIKYNEMTDAEKNNADGQELKAHIDELTEKAGVLKDAINDTNEAIKNAASDTRRFDQVASAIQLCIDGFGLATGAAQMLGLSNQDLVEVQTKLQAAMAASNAMSKIQATMQKQSALMQGVSTVQTKLHTLALKAETAAKGKGKIATLSLTIAQKAFNAACKANPILLLVGAVVAAVAAIASLAKVFSMFSGDSAKRKQAYKQETEQLEYMQECNQKAIDLAKARGASEAEASIMSIKAKKAEWEQASKVFDIAQRTYKEDDEEYKKAQENKKQSYNDFLDSLHAGNVQLTSHIQKWADKEQELTLGTYAFKQKKARETFQAMLDLNDELIAHGEITAFQWHENLQKICDAYNTEFRELKANEEKRLADSAREAANAAKRAVDEEKKKQDNIRSEWRKSSHAAIDIIEDRFHRERLRENQNYNDQLSDLKRRLEEIGETEVSMRDALNAQIVTLEEQHQLNLNAILRSEQNERFKVQQRIAQSILDTMEATGEQETAARMNLIHAKCNMELMEIEDMYRQEIITENEYEDLKANLTKKRWNEIEQIWIDTINARYDKEADIRAARFAAEEADIKARYLKEIKECGDNAEAREKIEAKYASRIEESAEMQAIESAQAEVQRLQEVLKEEDLTANQREELMRELTRAKTSLADAEADHEINAIKRVVVEDEKATQKRIANAQQWMQAVADSLNKINELVSTVYDGKISKVEDDQEANEAACEAEQERIAKLVEQNVITEEEGEARKRAAEDRTAKKTEELEKKKQQLKYKQAVWDKANSIAQCGISTALAIMNALQMQPFPVGIAMAAIAGAMGAVQLATILATPIPKYAKGTDYHKGGPAIVGDGGRPEVVVFKDTMWLTPDKPTLVNLPGGATVYPSISEYEAQVPGIINLEPYNVERPNIVVNNDYTKLEEKMDRVIYLFSALHRNRRDSDVESYLEIVKINKGL